MPKGDLPEAPDGGALDIEMVCGVTATGDYAKSRKLKDRKPLSKHKTKRV